MQILFLLAVISFLAMLWAGFALTRHVQRGGRRQSSNGRPAKATSEAVHSFSTPQTRSSSTVVATSRS